MNKKGLNISLTWLFVIMMVIVALAMAQNGYDAKSSNELFDKLNWTNISSGIHSSVQMNIDSASKDWIKVILSIADKAIEFFGYAVFELGKLAARVAIENPDIINYKVLFALLILCLIAPLIYPLFMITVSIILIIKEGLAVRKEKRKLKELEDINGNKSVA